MGQTGSLDRLQATWDRLRGGADLPLHSQITPETFRPWLSHLVIVEVHPVANRRFYYRLSGTALETAFNMRFAGRWLEDMRIPGSPGYWEGQYIRTAETRAPLGGEVQHYDPRFNQRVCAWRMLPFQPDLPPRGGPGPLDLVILAALTFKKA